VALNVFGAKQQSKNVAKKIENDREIVNRTKQLFLSLLLELIYASIVGYLSLYIQLLPLK